MLLAIVAPPNGQTTKYSVAKAQLLSPGRFTDYTSV